jgi:hypothetical protein
MKFGRPDIFESAKFAESVAFLPYFHLSIKIPLLNLKSVANHVVWILPPATTT